MGPGQRREAAIDFLKGERDRYHDLLQACENELEAYRATHYEDLPEVKDSIRRRLLDLRIEQDTRELQLKDAQSRLEGARKQLANIAPDRSGGRRQGDRAPASGASQSDRRSCSGERRARGAAAHRHRSERRQHPPARSDGGSRGAGQRAVWT